VRFFLDHDVPAEVARVLRQEGHEVIELREVLSVLATDSAVFDYARENQLLLITCNRDDFLPLASGSSNPGIDNPHPPVEPARGVRKFARVTGSQRRTRIASQY